MEQTKPSHALLDEWGLSLYLFDILTTCQQPRSWGDEDLQGSAQAMYKLIERGLLSGPERGKIRSRPFQTSARGNALVAKIERGLHGIVWLTRWKIDVLELLEHGGLAKSQLRAAGCHISSLSSLTNANYIKRHDNGHWYITDLGLAALQDWRESRRATELQAGPGREGTDDGPGDIR